MNKYNCIVVDPPWEYPEGWPSGSQRKSIDYPTLSVDIIMSIPIYPLIKLEGYVFLWVTNRYLEDGFKVMRSWRCVPKQTLVWCKKPHGVGVGGMFTTNTEFIIVGQRTGPRSHPRNKMTKGVRTDSSCFQWQRKKHIQKPEEFQTLLETLIDGPYLELFARRERTGWDVWGNEVCSNVEIILDDKFHLIQEKLFE